MLELSEHKFHLVKEFSEASFRIRRKDFDPKKPWNNAGTVPGTHLVMTVFGCLIYTLNQCATTMSDVNVRACATMIEVCTSYANVKDDFQSSIRALPLKQVTAEYEKLKRAQEAKKVTENAGESCKADIDKMASADDLCTTIVSIITCARAASTDQTASMKTASIIHALEEFGWNLLGKGAQNTLEILIKITLVLLISVNARFKYVIPTRFHKIWC